MLPRLLFWPPRGQIAVVPIVSVGALAAVEACSEGTLYCVLQLMVLAFVAFAEVLCVHYKLLGFEVWLAGAKGADL